MGKVFFLIVDDDPQGPRSMMRVCARYFLECGREIETHTAANANEALALVDAKLATHPEAEWGLMTDYDMPPGMDGLHLLEALDSKLGDKLPFRIVVTGDLSPERQSAIEAKSAFVEQKPMDSETLKSYLHIFLTSLS